MVGFVRSFVGAAVLLSAASAAPMPNPKPMPDSAIGAEIPVSAPNGIPMSDPPVLAASDSASNMMAQATATMMMSSSMSQPTMMMSSSMMAAPPMMSSMSQMMTMTAQAPAATSSSSWSMPSYGSGSNSWGGSSYNDCVQQCSASFGGPSPTQMSGDSSNSGGSGGATHTIIVAPSQGVLRYVPFSTNASVGDTVHFMWKANTHTVTRSSSLELCNKTSINTFASGVQQKDFTFDVKVNDSKPIWFYCGVADHCEKGMFGGVNIGQANPEGTGSSSGSSGSNYMPLSSVLPNMTQDSQVAAMWSYTKSQTGSDAYANGWGMGTNMRGMSPEAMKQVATNVMYNQMVIAKNPKNRDNKGTFFVSNDMVLPQDFRQAFASNSSASSSSTGTSSSTQSASAAGASSTGTHNNAKKNGAASVASSSVVVGFVAIAATFFAL